MHTMILRYDGLRSPFVTLRSTDRRGSWLTEVGFYNDALLHRKWGMNIQLACETGNWRCSRGDDAFGRGSSKPEFKGVGFSSRESLL